jgi:hypothetical protein
LTAVDHGFFKKTRLTSIDQSFLLLYNDPQFHLAWQAGSIEASTMSEVHVTVRMGGAFLKLEYLNKLSVTVTVTVTVMTFSGTQSWNIVKDS